MGHDSTAFMVHQVVSYSPHIVGLFMCASRGQTPRDSLEIPSKLPSNQPRLASRNPRITHKRHREDKNISRGLARHPDHCATSRGAFRKVRQWPIRCFKLAKCDSHCLEDTFTDVHPPDYHSKVQTGEDRVYGRVLKGTCAYSNFGTARSPHSDPKPQVKESLMPAAVLYGVTVSNEQLKAAFCLPSNPSAHVLCLLGNIRWCTECHPPLL